MPRGGGGPFHTTASAVWFVQELAWIDDDQVVRLVELPNRWARNPLDWQDARFSKVQFEKTDGAVVFFPPESQQAFILDLDCCRDGQDGTKLLGGPLESAAEGLTTDNFARRLGLSPK